MIELAVISKQKSALPECVGEGTADANVLQYLREWGIGVTTVDDTTGND